MFLILYTLYWAQLRYKSYNEFLRIASFSNYNNVVAHMLKKFDADPKPRKKRCG